MKKRLIFASLLTTKADLKGRLAHPDSYREVQSPRNWGD